ncbi:MAG TPA: hypothetical protein VNT00_07310 [Eoetvoesiella sp.]|uniref:hypothetical protein n=1 Tax=Eoetvoesiella sp. TaxID=1966355 RepID=UPI002BB3C42B|nr:hypothetical protein [Eoetvoesiella sp.]HWK61211.1 hypothetical protein [Eoetvoesiella sp.]
MFNKSTLALLFKHFDKTVCLKWSTIGVFVGILGWIWGQSKIPTTILKFASGFGWMLIAPMLVASILFLVAYFSKGRKSHLAYGDFQNAVAWAHPKLLRAISVFLGLMLSAAVCWAVTDSIYALKTVLLSALLNGVLLWIWAALLVTADELSKRFALANL